MLQKRLRRRREGGVRAKGKQGWPSERKEAQQKKDKH